MISFSEQFDNVNLEQFGYVNVEDNVQIGGYNLSGGQRQRFKVTTVKSCNQEMEVNDLGRFGNIIFLRNQRWKALHDSLKDEIKTREFDKNSKPIKKLKAKITKQESILKTEESEV